MKNCIIFLFCSFCILLSLKANVLNPESECKITFSSPWPIECKSSNKHYIVFSYKRLVENAFGLNKVPLQKGDWIGVFYKNTKGLLVCTDAKQIIDSSSAIQLEACGEFAPSTDDGFKLNENIFFQVFKSNITYFPGDIRVEFYDRFSISSAYPDGYDKFEGNQKISVIKTIKTNDLTTNPDCRSPRVLKCGDKVVNQSNLSGVKNAWSYNCFANLVDGPEMIYTFINGDNNDVKIVLDNLKDDLELILLNKCDNDNCISFSTKSGTTAESMIVRNLPGGEYFIIVEGYFGKESTFDLSVDCGDFPEDDFNLPPGGGGGSPVINPKNCGDSFVDNTKNKGTNKIFAYSPCSSGYYPGSEKVFTISFDKNGYIDLYVTPTNCELDIFVYDKFEAGACFISSTEPGLSEEYIRFYAVKNKNYYVFVDEYSTAKNDCNFAFRYSCYEPSGGGGPFLACYSRCDTFPELKCGIPVESNTKIGISCEAYWPVCKNSKGYQGKELLYTFRNSEYQDIVFRLYNIKEDLNIFIIDTCIGKCYEKWFVTKKDTSPVGIVARAMPPGIYTVVIETLVFGKESPFTLVVDCAKTNLNCFDIPISKGTSYVSSPINPIDPNMFLLVPENKYKGIIDVVTNDRFVNYSPGFTNQLSTTDLKLWSVADGYRITSQVDTSITICGVKADSNILKSVMIKDSRGDVIQHFIGYPFSESKLVKDAFGPKAKEFSSQVIHFFPDSVKATSESYNFIDEVGTNFLMETGVAYVLKVNKDGNFSYRSSDADYIPNGCNYFKTKIRQTLSLAWIKIPNFVLNQIVHYEDEIGIFNSNGLLVGSGKYIGQNLMITMQGDNTNTEGIEGLIKGERIIIKLYDRSSQNEKQLNVIWKETNIYEESKIYEIEHIAELATKIGSDFIMYPNPTRDETIIQFYSSNDEVGLISLIDLKANIHGSIRADIKKGWNFISLPFDRYHTDLNTGVYVVNLKTTTINLNKKLIVQK